jgi:hypothetical protein
LRDFCITGDAKIPIIRYAQAARVVRMVTTSAVDIRPLDMLFQ